MSVGFELDTTGVDSPEELDARETPEEGTYHLAVTECDLAPPKLQDCMRIEFEILAGTVAGQSGKSFSEIFNYPSAQAKDGGKFAMKRLAKLALSTGLMSQADLGKRVSINWEDLPSRQLVASVVKRKGGGENAGKYVQIDGLHIYSPTDPKVEAVPKDAEAMAMLAGVGEPERNAPAAASTATQATANAPAKPSANGNGSAPVAAAAAAGKPAAGKPGPDDFSDL